MTNPSRSSSLGEDPLHAYSGLALFPRTLKSMSITLPSHLYQSDDLQHTHNFLDAMPFEVQNELLDQAKAILADSSEILTQGIQTDVASKAESVEMNLIPNQRERRPGLGRTRARFSFKPTKSQPPPNEPSFDVSKYQNPEDFFAAYDKFENAKREWQKQTGSSTTDTNQNQPSMRPRRPGISGRVKASYKHRYSTDTINLEASEKNVIIPSPQSSPERTTAAHVMPVDREVDVSTMDIEKNVDNILGELLACTQDELEGDGAVNLLEERLQIKPIDIGKLSLPEFQDVGKIVLKASGRKTSNRRTVRSSIQNMLKGIHSDGARKSSHSPSPLIKSPVASLSLRKSLSSPNPPADEFSFPDSRHALPGDILASSLNQQSIEVELAKDSSICSRSSAINSDNDRTNVSMSNVGIVNVDSPLNSSIQKSSKEDGLDSCPGIHSSHSIADETAESCVDNNVTNRNQATLEVKLTTQAQGDEGYMAMGGIEMNRDSGRLENDADINADTHQLKNLAEDSSREGRSTVEKDSFPCQQDKSSKSPNGAPEYAEHIEEQQGAENDNTDTGCGVQVESVEEVHNCSHEQTNKRRKRGSGDNNKKKRSKTVHDESEGDKQMKANASRANKQMKRKSNEREEKKQKKAVTREGKVFSRRKSLAGAGTKWETGVRRSTRIKSRPLEYWKGERFLFGRIHESLATVIGIKYESESAGKSEKGKPALKVKSFVSDEYKELIELAALH